MLKAGDRLFVGGARDIAPRSASNARNTTDAHANASGIIQVFSSVDGKTLDTLSLSSPPVWDGMAAAGNRLFVALCDGSVASWGPSSAAPKSQDNAADKQKTGP